MPMMPMWFSGSTDVFSMSARMMLIGDENSGYRGPRRLLQEQKAHGSESVHRWIAIAMDTLRADGRAA